MEKELIRKRFRHYRNEIDRLQGELSDCYYWQGEQEAQVSRAVKQADACRRECEAQRRQEESDRYYREDQLRRATKELEQAQSYGDEWGEARALKKLKTIY